MLVTIWCGGCQGNHLLLLYVPHMTKLQKGPGMVSLGMSLKAMPSGLSWRHWPEGGSCCDAPEWGLGFRPTSLSVDWVEAAKERGDLGMGAPILSLTHSFILSNQEVLGLVPGGERQLRTGQVHPSLVGRRAN